MSSHAMCAGAAPRCHVRHQQHLRSRFHHAPFKRLLNRRKPTQLSSFRQSASCNAASAAEGASGGEEIFEYTSVYSLLPGDSE